MERLSLWLVQPIIAYAFFGLVWQSSSCFKFFVEADSFLEVILYNFLDKLCAYSDSAYEMNQEKLLFHLSAI